MTYTERQIFDAAKQAGLSHQQSAEIFKHLQEGTVHQPITRLFTRPASDDAAAHSIESVAEALDEDRAEWEPGGTHYDGCDSDVAEMYDADATALRSVASTLRLHGREVALAEAMTLDTACREEIPHAVWAYMGGTLTFAWEWRDAENHALRAAYRAEVGEVKYANFCIDVLGDEESDFDDMRDRA